MRVDAGDDVTSDLARGGRNPVDAVVHHRRHEQALPIGRDGHVIGAAGVERPLPQQPAAGQVECGDVAEIAARDVQRAAVGRDVGVLCEVGCARPNALGARGIDVDRADDRSRGHVNDCDRAALGVGDERHFDRGCRCLCRAAANERPGHDHSDECSQAGDADCHGVSPAQAYCDLPRAVIGHTTSTRSLRMP